MINILEISASITLQQDNESIVSLLGQLYRSFPDQRLRLAKVRRKAKNVFIYHRILVLRKFEVNWHHKKVSPNFCIIISKPSEILENLIPNYHN